MATVAITGAAGFLGSHLTDKFLSAGYQVKAIDNLIGGYLSNVHPSAEFINIDLSEDLNAVTRAFQDCEIVIHAACTPHEGLSVFSPSLITKHTLQATVNVMSAAAQAGVQRVLYLSSMARYGDHYGKVLRETDECRPQDPYGIAKRASELLVANIADTHGIEWVVLVPHNIIGSRQKYDDPFRNVASIMTNRMLQGKQPIIYGDGNQKRCFSFVDDVVNPIFVAATSEKALSRTINIGPDEEPITINDLAQRIADILDFDLDPIYVPDRPREVPLAFCSADLARDLLGYETTTDLDTGLQKLVWWIVESGAKPFEYHLPLEIVSELTPKTWSQRLM